MSQEQWVNQVEGKENVGLRKVVGFSLDMLIRG